MAASSNKLLKEGHDMEFINDLDDWPSTKGKPRVSIFDEDFGIDEDGFQIFGINKNQAAELSKSFKMSFIPKIMNTESDWDDLEISSALYRPSTTIISARHQSSLLDSSDENYYALESDDKSVSKTFRSPQFEKENFLQDCIEKSVKKYTLTDSAKIQSEFDSLKRSFEELKRNRWSPVPIEETIRAMAFSQPYSLSAYRSKHDKLAFLDAAIKTHDGNIITAAVIFLKNSVKPSIFHQEIAQRPIAINHYIHYLQSHREFSELVETLSFLGRFEEAALMQFKLAVVPQKAEIKINNLKKCNTLYFKNEPSLKFQNQCIEEYITLLEMQIPIEAADAQLSREGKLTYPSSVLNTNLINLLFYCCMNHFKESEKLLTSPMAIKNTFQLTNKQFAWVMLKARAQFEEWMNIREFLVIKKQTIFSVKSTLCLPAQRVITFLHKAGAPMEELEFYFTFIENSDQKIEYAKKMECHKVVIDTYVTMRDLQQLNLYSSKIPRNSRDAHYLADILRSSTIKWKT